MSSFKGRLSSVRQLFDRAFRKHQSSDASSPIVGVPVSAPSKTRTKALDRLNTLGDILKKQNGAVAHAKSAIDSTQDQVKTNVQSSEKIANLVKESSEAIQAGQVGLNRVVEVVSKSSEITQSGHKAMYDLFNELETVAQTLEGAKLEVEKIDQVVSTTRFLSFNASIEAARAGDAGKGFAVVAEEMITLAKISRQTGHAVREVVADAESHLQEFTEKSKHIFDDIANQQRSLITQRKDEIEKTRESFEKIVSSSKKVDSETKYLGMSLTTQNELLNEITQLLDSFCDNNLSTQEAAEKLIDLMSNDLGQETSQVASPVTVADDPAVNGPPVVKKQPTEKKLQEQPAGSSPPAADEFDEF